MYEISRFGALGKSCSLFKREKLNVSGRIYNLLSIELAQRPTADRQKCALRQTYVLIQYSRDTYIKKL